MKQEISHIIPIPIEDFWNTCFFTAEYSTAEHLEGLSCSDFTIIKPYTGAPDHKRILFSIPPLHVPASIKKIVGPHIGYTEQGVFDPQKQQYHFSLIPNVLPQKISIEGYYKIERVNDTSTKRTCFMETKVSIFGVGKKMEQLIGQSNLDIQKKTAIFAEQWVKRSI